MLYNNNKMKYFLNDQDLQTMSENLRKTLKEYYKDEVDQVDDHIIDTLCQNYVLDLKSKIKILSHTWHGNSLDRSVQS